MFGKLVKSMLFLGAINRHMNTTGSKSIFDFVGANRHFDTRVHEPFSRASCASFQGQGWLAGLAGWLGWLAWLADWLGWETWLAGYKFTKF